MTEIDSRHFPLPLNSNICVLIIIHWLQYTTWCTDKGLAYNSLCTCDNYLQHCCDPRILYLLKFLNLADVQILKVLWFVDGVVMFWCHSSGSAKGWVTGKNVPLLLK